MVHKYTLIEKQKQNKTQNIEDLLCAGHWMIHKKENPVLLSRGLWSG